MTEQEPSNPGSAGPASGPAGNGAHNTDWHLWPIVSDDPFAPKMHVTALGAIGINVGGHVIVKSMREWHDLAGPVEVGEWTEGVCGDGAAILLDGKMIPIEDVVATLNKYQRALSSLVKHWDEFGDLIVMNNAVNRDDYGMDERMYAAAKLVGM